MSERHPRPWIAKKSGCNHPGHVHDDWEVIDAHEQRLADELTGAQAHEIAVSDRMAKIINALADIEDGAEIEQVVFGRALQLKDEARALLKELSPHE